MFAEVIILGENKLVEKVNELVGNYENQLSELGIKCKVSKKYFETNAPAPYMHNDTHFLDMLLERLATKRENKYWKYQRNRYNCIVITFLPIINASKKQEYKEYSFLLNKTERVDIGFKPKEKNYKEEKILKRIEKRTLKFIEKSKNKTPELACKANLVDKFRYVNSIKYTYKQRIGNHDKSFWDTVLSVGFLLLVILIMLIICFII